MTGRPSGRCAARDVLAAARPYVAEWLYENRGSPEGKKDLAAIDAALASPCCVTGDQEQVKEALKRAERDSWRGGHMEDVRQYRAALALLGSHEEEEQ